jgi:hypothetical protein
MEYQNRQHINIVSLFTRRVWRYRKGNQNPYNTAVVICLCLLTRAWMFVFTDRHFYFLLTDRYLDACGYWREIECFIFTWIWMLVFTNKDLNALFLYVFGCLCLQIRVITKLPNSEQSYKGKVKTHNYINRQNQSTTGKLWKP